MQKAHVQTRFEIGSDWLDKYLDTTAQVQKKYNLSRDDAITFIYLTGIRSHLEKIDDVDPMKIIEVELKLQEVIDRPAKKGGGFVYLLKTKEKDLFKIGITKTSPLRRMPTLQTGCPFELTLFVAIYSYNCRHMETYFHTIFEQYHTYGEWYEVDTDIVMEKIANELADEDFLKNNDVSEVISPSFYLHGIMERDVDQINDLIDRNHIMDIIEQKKE